ncbi:hypothetical protein VPH35_042066 [Triticum aestivum]
MDRFSSCQPHGVATSADAAAAARYRASVILHKEAHFADNNEGRNATTAEAMTSIGHTVGVTFHLAHGPSPAVSHFRGHGPKLGRAQGDLLRERPLAPPPVPRPRVQNPEQRPWIARQVPHLQGPPRRGVAQTDPAPSDWISASSPPRRGWSARRGLELETPPNMSYKDRQRMPVDADKVIVLGGGEVGLVDLARGIRVCNVLDADPAFRLIPMPQAEFDQGRYSDSPRLFRDVAVRGDLIQFVEIDRGVDGAKKKSRKKVRTCYRRRSFVDLDDLYHDDDSCAPPELPSSSSDVGATARRYAFKDLVAACPAMSIVPGQHVVYLTSSVKFDGKKAWMIGLNLAKKKLEVLGPCSASYFNWPDFLVCAFSKYLNTTSNQVSV